MTIMYADDLMLLSSSVSGLQKLLDVCALTGKELCLQFKYINLYSPFNMVETTTKKNNDRKSHCVVIGPKYQCQIASLTLLGKPLQWVDSIKYLGIIFKSPKTFTLDIYQTRRKFFGCVNSIMNEKALRETQTLRAAYAGRVRPPSLY